MESEFKNVIIKVVTYVFIIVLIIISLIINYIYKLIDIYVLIAFAGFSFICYLSYKSVGSIEDKEVRREKRILTTTEARIEINKHLSKENNFRKMINWEYRKGFHSSTKTLHENGKDKLYYGVIAHLFNDFGKPLPEKIRIIWSLTDNEEYKLDILESNSPIIDPFSIFNSYQIVGGFKKPEQPAPNTAIYMDSSNHGNRHNRREDDGKFDEDKEDKEE